MMTPLIKTIGWSFDARATARPFLSCRHVFVLESSQHDPERGRFSVIGFDPFDVLVHKGADALDLLQAKLRKYKMKPAGGLPLCGGAVGYLSYDFGLYHEPVRLKAADDLKLPDCCFGFYDTVIIIDHLEDRLHIVSTGLPENSFAARKKRAAERLKMVEDRLKEVKNTARPAYEFREAGAQARDKSNFTKKKYCSTIARALEYIKNGDIYQVNISQRFCWTLPSENISAFDIYDVLSEYSPTPFGCFFQMEKK